jgi:hypothetical protein
MRERERETDLTDRQIQRVREERVIDTEIEIKFKRELERGRKKTERDRARRRVAERNTEKDIERD